MTFADDLVALFEDASLGVYEESIFVNFMPDTPDKIIVITETPGFAPQTGFGVAGIQHEQPGAQIRVRGETEDVDEPRARAQSAYRLCATVQGMQLDSALYLMIRPTQAPFVLMRDDNERVVWTFNLLAEKELSS